jgi:hypothetical protein
LGERVTLTATGGTTYEWSTGESTASIEVSPSSTETYMVTAKDGNVTDEDEVIITVNSVTAHAGEDVTIDEGNSVKLTASGGDTYLWSTGETTKSISVSPNETKTYEVTAMTDGCESTDEVKVTVEGTKISNPPPTMAFAGDDISICLGESVTLEGTGGATYTWSTGSNQKNIEVNPTRTTVFILTATNKGITTTDSVVVSVENCNLSFTPEDKDNLEDFTVYPNPSAGVLNISMGSPQKELNLVLISSSGRIVYSDKMNTSQDGGISKQIDLSKFAKGIYFVRLSNASQNIVKKIILI